MTNNEPHFIMAPAKSVDEYIARIKQWKEELILLREIVLSSGLTETIKWGAPIYTFNGKNIAGLAAFKSYVGLWFHQGALLTDKKKKLINAQEGKTRALRQWRFGSLEEIDTQTITSYLREAIQNTKAGKEIKPVRKKALQLPTELQKVLAREKEILKNFKSFSIARQREYAEYILEAARPETKLRRIEKILPMISKGIGLNDQYR